MKELTAQEVRIKVESEEDVQLIMTLSPENFAVFHIPGSINICNIDHAKEQFPLDTKIIVYCSDRQCLSSYYAYHELKRSGYRNIWRFSGGLREWQEAGFPLIKGKSLTHLVTSPSSQNDE